MACDWRDAVVLVQVTDGMLQMFCNWLTSVRSTLKLENDVYVAMHGSNLAGLQKSLSNLEIRSEHLLHGNMSVGTSNLSNFGGSSFYALNTAKISYALELLERTGRPVLFSDIDTVWLKDPFSHLARTLNRDSVFAVGPDANDKLHSDVVADALAQRHHVCACFFAACPSAAWLLKDWRSATIAAGGGGGVAVNEQKALQRMLDRRPGLVVRGNKSTRSRVANAAADSGGMRSARTAVVTILDPAHFPTGQKDPPIVPSHVWMHANWIQRRTRASTTTAKRLRLQKRGVWNPRCNGELG